MNEKVEHVIYQIKNKKTGRKLLSVKPLETAEASIKASLKFLRTGKFIIPELQKDWKKLGEENFEIEVLKKYSSEARAYSALNLMMRHERNRGTWNLYNFNKNSQPKKKSTKRKEKEPNLPPQAKEFFSLIFSWEDTCAFLAANSPEEAQ